MIVSMLAFEIAVFAFFCETYNTTPFWLRIIMMGIWLIAHCVAYGSEETLRNKIKDLEDEVNKLKKGGAE